MMIATVAGMLSASTSQAAWFTRLDDNGSLVATAVGLDDEGDVSGLYLTCQQALFSVTVLTSTTPTDPKNLENYSDAKVIFGVRTEALQATRFGTDGKAVLVPGNLVAVRTLLSPEQSKLLREWISKGLVMEIDIVQPLLVIGTGVRRVAPDGYLQLKSAFEEHCRASP